MAKRRVKKRTQAAGKAATPGNVIPSKQPGARMPKSMVIRIGASEVGPSVTQLVRDVRKMMEPETASRLQERRSNKLRDFTTMAGPLGVTHLLLFSRSTSGNTTLRLALTPRGPTLHFRVEKYSLCKDVHKSMRRPKSGGSEYLTAPLLVMNNFMSSNNEDQKSNPKVPKHLESLTTTVFQSLFPPINPTKTPLKNIKRVLLLDRAPAAPTDSENDSAPYVLNLRHYAIETRTAKSAVPKPLRRLDAASKLSHAGTTRKREGLPNLGRLDDVADYLLDPSAAGDGFTSGSESEPDTDAEVDVLAHQRQKVHAQQRRAQKAGGEAESEEGGRTARKSNTTTKANVERKAIKLHELGPRLRLRLTKVEEAVCGGKTMWHEYIHKTKEEEKQMDRLHEERRQQRERRKAEQKANVERKRAERKANGGEGGEEEDELDEEDFDDDDDEWNDEGAGEDVEMGENGEDGEEE